MTLLFRIEMFVVALLFFIFIVRSINKNNFSLKFAFSWIVTSIILIICALFPRIPIWLSEIFGFEKPVNFLMLMGIFFLLIIVFQNTLIISNQQEKIKTLIQEISISNQRKKDK